MDPSSHLLLNRWSNFYGVLSNDDDNQRLVPQQNRSAKVKRPVSASAESPVPKRANNEGDIIAQFTELLSPASVEPPVPKRVSKKDDIIAQFTELLSICKGDKPWLAENVRPFDKKKMFNPNLQLKQFKGNKHHHNYETACRLLYHFQNIYENSVDPKLTETQQQKTVDLVNRMMIWINDSRILHIPKKMLDELKRYFGAGIFYAHRQSKLLAHTGVNLWHFSICFWDIDEAIEVIEPLRRYVRVGKLLSNGQYQLRLTSSGKDLTFNGEDSDCEETYKAGVGGADASEKIVQKFYLKIPNTCIYLHCDCYIYEFALLLYKNLDIVPPKSPEYKWFRMIMTGECFC
jgi:hypothetical protein